MADVWYDPDGTNTAPYDTQIKAATTLQTAVDTAAGAAGNNLYTVARAVETLAAPVDIDTGSGTIAAGHINWIGVNTSGVEDSTRFVLDGNSAAANCILFNNRDYWRIRNVEVKNATSHGINDTNTCNYNIFENIYSHDNGGSGIEFFSGQINAFRNCRIENNTSYGLRFKTGLAWYNSISGNGNYGIYSQGSGDHIYGSLLYNNTTGQVFLVGAYGKIVGCTVDGWNGLAAAGIGVNTNNLGHFVVNCRITHNASGIKLNAADYTYYDRCGFYGNTADITAAAGNRPVDSGENTSMAAHGYNNLGTGDYNLTTGAEVRRVEIDLD